MAAAGETPALTGRGYCHAGEGARATHTIQDVPSLGSAVLGQISAWGVQITNYKLLNYKIPSSPARDDYDYQLLCLAPPGCQLARNTRRLWV